MIDLSGNPATGSAQTGDFLDFSHPSSDYISFMAGVTASFNAIPWDAFTFDPSDGSNYHNRRNGQPWALRQVTIDSGGAEAVTKDRSELRTALGRASVSADVLLRLRRPLMGAGAGGAMLVVIAAAFLVGLVGEAVGRPICRRLFHRPGIATAASAGVCVIAAGVSVRATSGRSRSCCSSGSGAGPSGACWAANRGGCDNVGRRS